MSGSSRPTRGALLQGAVVVAVFAVVGVAAGFGWYALWDAPRGVAFEGRWVPDPSDQGYQAAFDGTGLYVLLGAPAGLVLGVLAAVLARRSELVTLAAVLLGAVVAGVLTHQVGLALSPPDPAPIAATAEDLTEIPGALSIPGTSPFIAWPLGGLMGLGVTYLFGLGAGEVRRREEFDESWLRARPAGDAGNPVA